jgi:hypothetical protein
MKLKKLRNALNRRWIVRGEEPRRNSAAANIRTCWLSRPRQSRT